jgi:hypothetical protein
MTLEEKTTAAEENHLVIYPYDPMARAQQWTLTLTDRGRALADAHLTDQDRERLVELGHSGKVSDKLAALAIVATGIEAAFPRIHFKPTSARTLRREEETPAWFPIQAAGKNYERRAAPMRCPWSVAEKAFGAYASQHGTSQSLRRLAERGGFGVEEMDILYPAWREETSEIIELRQRVAELEARPPKITMVDVGIYTEDLSPERIGEIIESVQRITPGAPITSFKLHAGELTQMRERIEDMANRFGPLCYCDSSADDDCDVPGCTPLCLDHANWIETLGGENGRSGFYLCNEHNEMTPDELAAARIEGEKRLAERQEQPDHTRQHARYSLLHQTMKEQTVLLDHYRNNVARVFQLDEKEAREEFEQRRQRILDEATGCRAASPRSDGECHWAKCPQLHPGERQPHCPLDVEDPDADET